MTEDAIVIVFNKKLTSMKPLTVEIYLSHLINYIFLVLLLYNNMYYATYTRKAEVIKSYVKNMLLRGINDINTAINIINNEYTIIILEGLTFIEFHDSIFNEHTQQVGDSHNIRLKRCIHEYSSLVITFIEKIKTILMQIPIVNTLDIILSTLNDTLTFINTNISKYNTNPLDSFGIEPGNVDVMETNKTNAVNKYIYGRKMLFQEYINNLQGNFDAQGEKVIELVKDRLNKYMKNNDYSNVTEEHIIEILRETNNTKHIDNITSIYNHIKGIKQEYSYELERNILRDFNVIINMFIRKYNINNRKKNFLNLRYILYILSKKNGYKQCVNDYVIFKTPERRIMYEKVLGDIFKTLNWEFPYD